MRAIALNSIFSKAKNPQDANSIAFFHEFYSKEVNLSLTLIQPLPAIFTKVGKRWNGFALARR
jgi:hypothetical protein